MNKLQYWKQLKLKILFVFYFVDIDSVYTWYMLHCTDASVLYLALVHRSFLHSSGADWQTINTDGWFELCTKRGIIPSAAEEHSSIKATPAARLLLGLYNGKLTCPQPITKPAHFSLSTTKGLLRSQRTTVSHQGCRSSRAVPSDCGELRLLGEIRWLCCGPLVVLFMWLWVMFGARYRCCCKVFDSLLSLQRRRGMEAVQQGNQSILSLHPRQKKPPKHLKITWNIPQCIWISEMHLLLNKTISRLNAGTENEMNQI